MFSDDEDIHVPREGTSSKRDASDLKAASKVNKKRRCKKVANEKVANEKTTDMQKATQAFIAELRRLAKVMLES